MRSCACKTRRDKVKVVSESKSEEEGGRTRRRWTYVEVVVLGIGESCRVEVFDEAGGFLLFVGFRERFRVDVAFLYQPGAELCLELGCQAFVAGRRKGECEVSKDAVAQERRKGKGRRRKGGTETHSVSEMIPYLPHCSVTAP